MNTSQIAVLGAGSWGTALALLLGREGHRVTVWDHFQEHITEIARERENRRYLPGYGFPDSITPTPELEIAVSGADVEAPSCGRLFAFSRKTV